MPVYRLGDRVPSIHRTAYVHPSSVLIGDVTVGPEASIWPCAVLRGDYGHIETARIVEGAADLDFIVSGTRMYRMMAARYAEELVELDLAVDDPAQEQWKKFYERKG